MSDQFCLKWNNHHTTLVTVFDKLFECESLVDCTLAAEGKYMKAHKVVLSACSSYLEEILKNTDDKHPILIFNDISYDELKAMLEYMYRGEVNVSQDQLSTFIKAAEALKIKGLTTDQGGGQASSQELRRKVGLKDSRSHSPVVGMTPVERPTSPKRKRRRSRDDNFAADSNSCDTASTPPPTQNSSNMTPKNEEKTTKMKKESSSEPSTTPTKLLQPKIEFMDDSRNMEEYSLEEDEDYGPNPGTSQGSFFGGQDFNNWTGSESQHDDVSIGSQNELNNTAGNSQGKEGASKKKDELEVARVDEKISKRIIYVNDDSSRKFLNVPKTLEKRGTQTDTNTEKRGTQTEMAALEKRGTQTEAVKRIDTGCSPLQIEIPKVPQISLESKAKSAATTQTSDIPISIDDEGGRFYSQLKEAHFPPPQPSPSHSQASSLSDYSMQLSPASLNQNFYSVPPRPNTASGFNQRFDLNTPRKSKTVDDDKISVMHVYCHCGRRFRNDGQLKHHHKYECGNTTRVFCQCGRKFKNESFLKYHKKNECGLSWKCVRCQKSYKSKQNYALHMKTTHPDIYAEMRNPNPILDQLIAAPEVHFVPGYFRSLLAGAGPPPVPSNPAHHYSEPSTSNHNYFSNEI